MLAIGLIKGQTGVHQFEVQQPVIKQPDEVLVRVKEVGVDGTDINMVRYNLQDIAGGSHGLVMGHEMVGLVEETGSSVKTLKCNDIVALTVRRGCGICQPCLHNQSDMCMTGLYTERGLHRRDGYLTRLVVDKEQYMAKVPNGLERLAVLTEPLSIAEKGIEQIRFIQSRLPWSCSHPAHSFKSKQWGSCKTALVVGAGSLGLLAAALLRLSGILTYVADILPQDSLKAQLVADMQATYVDARKKTPEKMVQFCCRATGKLDIIFEAAGAAATALELINYMSRSSIYVMTGIPREELSLNVDAARLVRQIVRQNQVIVGSINSNHNHFERAIKDIPDIDLKYEKLLEEMITHRFKLNEYRKAFEEKKGDHIKTVIEVEPWK
ncbi:alcohol dehydrogenase catalytic domain-containing protein [Chloroflexota bacterium]